MRPEARATRWSIIDQGQWRNNVSPSICSVKNAFLPSSNNAFPRLTRSSFTGECLSIWNATRVSSAQGIRQQRKRESVCITMFVVHRCSLFVWSSSWNSHSWMAIMGTGFEVISLTTYRPSSRKDWITVGNRRGKRGISLPKRLDSTRRVGVIGLYGGRKLLREL